jgi:hypothetical protein
MVIAAARALFMAASFLVLAAVASDAQEMVRFVGSVQWIAGSRMQVVTQTGASVLVDLTEADQSAYRALRTGDAVVVDGLVFGDRRGVVAYDLWRDSGSGYWTQSP